jgi:predicted nucleic acid-binding protein
VNHPSSSDDRSRYECHFRIDAGETASAVLAWVGAQPRETLYTTSIAMLPTGRRRIALAAAAQAMFAEDLAGRVLPYDSLAAAQCAEIVVARRRAGSPMEAFDALIAATALSAGARLATRDVGGFDGCGLDVVDPWAAP